MSLSQFTPKQHRKKCMMYIFADTYFDAMQHFQQQQHYLQIKSEDYHKFGTNTHTPNNECH